MHTDSVLGLNNIAEPCFLVYDVPTPLLEEALLHLRLSLKVDAGQDSLVPRCREKRIERIQNINEVVEKIVSRRHFGLLLDTYK
jgi:proteasome activator subunit 4